MPFGTPSMVRPGSVVEQNQQAPADYQGRQHDGNVENRVNHALAGKMRARQQISRAAPATHSARIVVIVQETRLNLMA